MPSSFPRPHDRGIELLLWLPPTVQEVSPLFAHVIDCELLSGLGCSHVRVLAGMVICGSGPNLTAGLYRPQLIRKRCAITLVV